MTPLFHQRSRLRGVGQRRFDVSSSRPMLMATHRFRFKVNAPKRHTVPSRDGRTRHLPTVISAENLYQRPRTDLDPHVGSAILTGLFDLDAIAEQYGGAVSLRNQHGAGERQDAPLSTRFSVSASVVFTAWHFSQGLSGHPRTRILRDYVWRDTLRRLHV
jgi:hypothetical protein